MSLSSRDLTVLNKLSTQLNSDCALGTVLNGVYPSHVVMYAGKHTTVGGGASEAITVSGVLSSDIVIATLQAKGATPRTILTAAPTADTITVVFSGDPSTDHVVSYMVLRAAA